MHDTRVHESYAVLYGVSGQLHAPSLFNPGEKPPLHTGLTNGSASELFCTWR